MRPTTIIKLVAAVLSLVSASPTNVPGLSPDAIQRVQDGIHHTSYERSKPPARPDWVDYPPQEPDWDDDEEAEGLDPLGPKLQCPATITKKGRCNGSSCYMPGPLGIWANYPCVLGSCIGARGGGDGACCGMMHKGVHARCPVGNWGSQARLSR